MIEYWQGQALKNILGSVGKLEYDLSIRVYKNKLKFKVKIVNWIKQVAEWSVYYDFILVRNIMYTYIEKYLEGFTVGC